MESLFFELGLVIISAALVGAVSYYLRQPLILAYIAAGILIGPFGFGLVHDIETIHIIAQIGIMLMLFLVGLEMNPERLKNLGLVALATGVGQVLFTGGIGYGIAYAFGFPFVQAIYLAIALTFSSTVIAIKIIYDKRDNNALYGQVAIGVLLVQDIIAILALLALTGFKVGSFSFDFVHFGLVLAKGTILFTLAIIVARRLLSYVYNKIATSHELLILFSLAWAFLVALLSEKIGFNVEIGAFIAGVSLASLPYTFEINAKAKILRDFFITIFFVGLGAGLVFSSMGPLVAKFVALSLFVLIGNPIIVMVIMGALGYDKRTSFFTGLSVANISEFSLIVAAMGLNLRHLDVQVVSMITIIGLLTMTISSYMMVYNNQLYNFLKPLLNIFEFKNVKTKLSTKKFGMQNHIILLGCGGMGQQILDQVKEFKDEYLVIDHDNSVIKDLIKKGVTCIFGDIEDAELVNELDLEDAEIIISTLPSPEDNFFLIKHIEKIPHNKRPIVIVTADTGREGLALFNKGADYVILKPYLGASHIHDINKQLYGLEEETGLQLVQEVADESRGKFKSDQDYAKVLNNLNKLRLAEIRQKIGKGHIVLKPKAK
ncbi:MAG: cation:proton antiporter [Actinobacteria bacterium]|nr:cation:proton antiporter [Patescibacteria group bacterium]MBU1495048.1 cation:proton antiporter [Actinomycetota bacterium]